MGQRHGRLGVGKARAGQDGQGGQVQGRRRTERDREEIKHGRGPGLMLAPSHTWT